jgi:hypothetical protein
MNLRERSDLGPSIFRKGDEQTALISLPLAVFYTRKLFVYSIPEMIAGMRLWPRAEMRRCFVLNELRHILLVSQNRVEIAKSDRHDRLSHRCKLAKHLWRAQHAVPLRKKVESKFRRSKSGNFGDLSGALVFVLCGLRSVLIPEFGDLI